ncbi:hypothetical protein NEFER03_0353 [Nematocida sp. LUAm3]|nr:hypothetical protein NEFER03_0353 [Nematocida sp. LUAm3]KAI5175873.1 hypothetical protein NEFER02_1733 [Nematocida sp. LUAm2]KAI5178662.1 hypothetical protein NEFER01_1781 [Nematocida sp. LUAm1]
MARKKPTRSVRKKVTKKEENRFPCPECNRESVVQCRVDHQKKTGRASCAACSYTFECPTNNLSQAIDVYTEWLDEKEAQKKRREKKE